MIDRLSKTLGAGWLFGKLPSGSWQIAQGGDMNNIERKCKHQQAHELLARANRILEWVYREASRRAATEGR